MPKSPSQPEVSPQTAAPAQEPIPSAGDNFVSIPLEDFTVRVTEINHPDMVAQQMQAKATPDKPAQGFDQATYDEAEVEALRHNFTAQWTKAQEPPPPPYKPPPVAPAVAEQTRLEMEAGRAKIAEWEARKVQHPRPAPEQTSTAILRPEDFVPNMNQGQKASNSTRGTPL